MRIIAYRDRWHGTFGHISCERLQTNEENIFLLFSLHSHRIVIVINVNLHNR